MSSGAAIDTAREFWIPSVQVTPTERNAVLLLKLESDRLVRDNEQSSKFHTPSGMSLGRTMLLWTPVASDSQAAVAVRAIVVNVNSINFLFFIVFPSSPAWRVVTCYLVRQHLGCLS